MLLFTPIRALLHTNSLIYKLLVISTYSHTLFVDYSYLYISTYVYMCGMYDFAAIT